MNRLTNKELHIVEDMNKALDKLSQLEDIEEELGIDLFVLFKLLLKARTIVLASLFDLETKKPVKYDTCVFFCVGDEGIIYKNRNEVFHKAYYKDYGKTWALTKEELEK